MPPIHFGTFQDNFPTGITYARQARRLYIGNVSDDATDESLGAFFNNEMRNRNLTLDEKVDVQSEHPVIKVDINKVKNYAFIEVIYSSFSHRSQTFTRIALTAENALVPLARRSCVRYGS